VPPQQRERLGGAAVLRPSRRRAAVGGVDHGGIGAPVKEQLHAAEGVVLGGQMHGHRSDAVAFAAPIVAQIGIGAVVLLFMSVLNQLTPHAYLIHLFEQMADGLYEQLRQMEGLRDEEAMAAALEALPRAMVAVLPAVCAINFLFPNVLNYLLARRYLQHHEPPVPFTPADIADWRATDYLVWVFLASGAALFLPLSTLSHIGLNVFLVTLAIYFIQGLAILVYWGRRLPLPSAACWLLAILAFVLAAPFCMLACTVAGLFDLWVDFRRQRRQLPEH